MTAWMWVGEHGPELVNLPPDAQVIPLPKPPQAEMPEGTP